MDSYRDFSINFLGDLQKMEQVQNDMNNLIELIRRAQTTGNWNIDGLLFYCFDINDVLNPNMKRVCVPSCCDSMKVSKFITVTFEEFCNNVNSRRVQEQVEQLFEIGCPTKDTKEFYFKYSTGSHAM